MKPRASKVTALRHTQAPNKGDGIAPNLEPNPSTKNAPTIELRRSKAKSVSAYVPANIREGFQSTPTTVPLNCLNPPRTINYYLNTKANAYNLPTVLFPVLKYRHLRSYTPTTRLQVPGMT